MTLLLKSQLCKFRLNKKKNPYSYLGTKGPIKSIFNWKISNYIFKIAETSYCQ